MTNLQDQDVASTYKCDNSPGKSIPETRWSTCFYSNVMAMNSPAAYHIYFIIPDFFQNYWSNTGWGKLQARVGCKYRWQAIKRECYDKKVNFVLLGVLYVCVHNTAHRSNLHSATFFPLICISFDSYTILFFVYEYREMRGCTLEWLPSGTLLRPSSTPSSRSVLNQRSRCPNPSSCRHTHTYWTQHRFDFRVLAWLHSSGIFNVSPDSNTPNLYNKSFSLSLFIY